jgi:hypothetical protein
LEEIVEALRRIGVELMTVLTQGRRVGAYLMGETETATGTYCREVVTFASGAVIGSGTVVAKLTTGGKFVPLAAVAAVPDTGSHIAAGIAYGDVDASAADNEGVITARGSEVNGAELIWPAGITDPAKATAIAALKAIGIIVR